MTIEHAALDLKFEEAFDGAEPLEAYEELLLDAMAGDHLLFTSTAEVERLWELCDPVLADPPPVLPYAQGSWARRRRWICRGSGGGGFRRTDPWREGCPVSSTTCVS